MPKTRRNKKRGGGKFLGEGTYGCGFAESELRCKDGSSIPGDLVKLLVNKGEAHKEYTISKVIRTVDPERKYFITADKACEHDTRTINRGTKKNNSGRNRMCKFNQSQESYLIFYELGGDNLEDIKVCVDKYPSFIRGFRNLIEGLAILHKNNIVHCDIKPDNMVSKLVNGEYNTRFIDFGLSVLNTTDLYPQSQEISLIAGHVYKTYHLFYPLDAIAMAGMTLRNDKMNKWYDAMLRQSWYTDNIRLKDYLYQSAIYKPGKVKYTDAEVNKEYQLDNQFYSNIKRGLESVDVYSLGVSLSIIYSRMTGHYNKINPVDGKQTIALFTPTGFVLTDKLDNTIDTHKWHIELSKFSYRFFILIAIMTSTFGKDRITAEKALLMINDLLIDVDKYFTNIDLTYRALKSIGIKSVILPDRPSMNKPPPRPLPVYVPQNKPPRPLPRLPLAPYVPQNKPPRPPLAFLPQQVFRKINVPKEVAPQGNNWTTKYLNTKPTAAQLYLQENPKELQMPQIKRQRMNNHNEVIKNKGGIINIMDPINDSDMLEQKLDMLKEKHKSHDFKDAGKGYIMWRLKGRFNRWTPMPKHIL